MTKSYKSVKMDLIYIIKAALSIHKKGGQQQLASLYMLYFVLKK